ncbi:MAG TPA: metal-dependent hydrolase [Moraxellaceae bacterium]|nr:metal-dependent hydrolase [Moraxellaceae bacterium]
MNAHQSYPDAGITVRRMDFEFSNVPRYWADKDPHFTHLLNALSATFPEGERFFVHSVRHFQNRITDPVLRQQVSAFIGQEAMHAKEHSHYNEYARQHGIDLGFIENFARQRMAFIKDKMSPERQLAITCALEHFTAILAEQMLTEPDIFEKFDPSMMNLWLWHAVEESEHKGVAFDVYQDLVGDYRLRIRAMAITTFFFIMHTTWFQARLLKADGKLFDVRIWLKGLDRMWGRKGHFRKLIPSYLQYYRPDFHPWQHDNRAVLEKWKRALNLDDAAVGKKTVAAAAVVEPVPAPAPAAPARTARPRQPVAAKSSAKARTVTKASPAPKAVKLKSLDKPTAKATTGSKAGARPRKTNGGAEPVPT